MKTQWMVMRMDGHTIDKGHCEMRMNEPTNEERTNEERNAKQTKDSIEKSNLLCDYFNPILFQFFFVYFFSRIFFHHFKPFKAKLFKADDKDEQNQAFEGDKFIGSRIFNGNLWYTKETQTFVLLNLFYLNPSTFKLMNLKNFYIKNFFT